MEKILFLGIIFAVFLVVAGQQKQVVPRNCPECQPGLCKAPKDCLVGLTKDRCGCCDVCARSEGQACDLDTGYKYGTCGEGLVCQLRDDIDPKLHQAVCRCKDQKAVCGTNDITYENVCQMAADSVIENVEISIKFKHPCKTVPFIRSPPNNVKNTTGANVFLSCEATGYPIPSISWKWSNNELKDIALPTDDLHVSVNIRGGPERYMVTGWLQIMDLEDKHQGDYTCYVRNEVGVASAVARVNVVDQSRL